MKLSLVISIFVVGFLSSFPFQLYAQNTGRGQFTIYENGKYGCINDKGKVIIEPIFANLGGFTEGVAPARIDGYFGFIDTLGQWKIPPQFEYATEFHENAAIVYHNGTSFYINQKGQKLFDTSMAESIENFENGLARFKTRSHKIGLWDSTGHIVVDTIFGEITPFQNDLAVVKSELPTAENHWSIGDFGVIDRKGAFIVPFGKYWSIIMYPNGYFIFLTTVDENSNRTYGILDKNCKEIFRHPFKNHESIEISETFELKKDCFIVNLYDEEKAKVKADECSYCFEYSYKTLMNLKGEIVLDTSLIQSVYYFDDKKIIGRGKNHKTLVVDWQGKPLKQANLEAVNYDELFQNHITLQGDNSNNKKGVIDTNGHWLVKPIFKDEVDIAHFSDGFIFFSKETNEIIENTRYKRIYPDSFEQEYYETLTLWGIANNKGKILTKPQLLSYDRDGYKNGLLSVIFKDHTFGYLDKTGKKVWQQTISKPKRIDTLDIDFNFSGDYAAASDSKSNNDRYGGWAKSTNKAKQVAPNNNFPSHKFSITVNQSDTALIEGNWLGYKVFVANLSSDTLFFDAQNSHLDMSMQAIDSSGKWRDIEHLSSSWCGNSYHKLALDPNFFWTFTTPQYKGVFKTRFRLALDYTLTSTRTKKEDILTIYSNEWTGSVNPSQFWRKKGYASDNIMDPYRD